MHQLTRNVALAVACARDGRTHREIAQAAEVSRETFGGCISGRVRPSDSLKARISFALGVPVSELFDVEAASA